MEKFAAAICSGKNAELHTHLWYALNSNLLRRSTFSDKSKEAGN
jgi:hypothetical protein